MWSSKGSGGWKNSSAIIKPPTAVPSVEVECTDMEGIELSGAKGSMAPPMGAKVSNESAASVGGGESEELVAGDGWLYTVDGISNAPAAESDV